MNHIKSKEREYLNYPFVCRSEKSITLDSDMVRKIVELVKKKSRSFSNTIQRILEEYFKTVKTAKYKRYFVAYHCFCYFAKEPMFKV